MNNANEDTYDVFPEPDTNCGRLKMDIVDRKRGTLIGLAVGDALGAAVELQMPCTFEPVTGYRSGGPRGLVTGQWGVPTPTPDLEMNAFLTVEPEYGNNSP